MDFKEIEDLLIKHKIKIPRYQIINDIDEVDNLNLNYPVVLKIVSSTITHKSDVGGVVTNIYDKEALIRAIQKLKAQLSEKKLTALIEGFRVEEQITDGLEFLLGSSYDSSFGIVGAFGFGGIAVELYQDVVFFLPEQASSHSRVKHIISKTKIGKKLLKTHEFRGKRININALYDAVVGFSQLLHKHALSNLEINPLICNSQGCWACDIRYKRK
ncbi:MAG: hypothetical protein GXN99_01180 [Candidatus Nanohaloarchaeota archaeon]|nr:hypothetical protein [Candidatus Nanohaloarchaeota archaeon]